MNNTAPIYKLTARMVMFIVLSVAALKVSHGFMAPVFTLAGMWCAFSGKIGWSLVFYILMPFMMVLSPALSPRGNFITAASMRFGPLFIGLLLACMASARRGRHRLPLGAILPFMAAAAISSMDGWAPLVSYFKIINFLVFMLGIWFGTQNLQHRPKDILILRSFFLALAAVVILGSLVVMPFPGISYATTLGNMDIAGGSEASRAALAAIKAEGGRPLFCGVMCHSQALSPILVALFTWVACDMLFLEQRFHPFHVALLFFGLVLCALTRSRVALLSLTSSLAIIAFYTTRKVQIPSAVRQSVGKGLFVGILLLFCAAVAAQLKSGAMSKWIRKTGDSEGDRRTLMQAFTESRLGLLEYSLWEFRRSPLFGSGFQVADFTRDQVAHSRGLILSSPIEKGVLPVMVLGETGILGEICFLFFLLAFFIICSSRHYYITLTTFGVFLVTNMGEATFFSPGGNGGILWMISAIGGFSLDTALLYRRNLEQQWRQMNAFRPRPLVRP